MKAVRRRLGILAICIALVLVSVSLGTWVTKRRGEMGKPNPGPGLHSWCFSSVDPPDAIAIQGL